MNPRIPPPVIEGLSRKSFYRNITVATVLGIGLAECYWHFYVLPRRKKRDEFFEHFGIKYEKLA